ncbi:hypothetical protein G7054_g7738 [Neopestalotiopsis clavispora]|nr:hypothetical protein G7054_g7738 [Neopestalotiopsis clavispora]
MQKVLDTLSPNHEWTVDSLKWIFERAVFELKGVPVTILIDALDECGTSQVRDMVGFFDELSKTYNHLYVCFASRHYPHITTVASLEIVLEHQTQHQDGIERYLSSKLQIGRGKLTEQIRSDILAKASGVFMWVVLVVDILNREFDAGRKHRLRKRLEPLPKDLHELFRDILTRDTENVDGLLLCIQWLLFSRRPLTPEELYLAMISGLEPEYLEDCHLGDVSDDDIRKYILDNSKGLAEPVGIPPTTVQFIHESVVDFLIKDNGLSKIFFDLGGELTGKSHNALKCCCLEYIDFVHSLGPRHQSKSMGSNTEFTGNFPFESYAQKELIFHANEAEASGVDQKDFMADLRNGKWVSIMGSSPSLLYSLARQHASSLIRAHPTDLSCFTIDEMTEQAMPIKAAITTGGSETALSLLEMEVRRTPGLSFQDLLDQVRKPDSKVFLTDWDRSLLSGGDIFVQLARFAPELVTVVFLRTNKTNLNVTDLAGHSALFHSISRRHHTLLQHLIDMGVDVSLCDKEGRLPTHWAVQLGSVTALDTLVKSGCDIDARDNKGRTPLHCALRERKFPEMIDILLQKGAHIDARDMEGRTPLHYTMPALELLETEKLLSYGADASVGDDQGQTPLVLAIRSNPLGAHTLRLCKAIRLFHKYGADISATGHIGASGLHVALGYGLHDCVVQLVECGADISKSDANLEKPIWWAVCYASPPHLGSIQFLIDHGANIRDLDEDGYTLLHRAVEQDQADVVEVLVKNGAPTDTRNKHGQSPLDTAWSLGDVGIISQLS